MGARNAGAWVRQAWHSWETQNSPPLKEVGKGLENSGEQGVVRSCRKKGPCTCGTEHGNGGFHGLHLYANITYTFFILFMNSKLPMRT